MCPFLFKETLMDTRNSLWSIILKVLLYLIMLLILFTVAKAFQPPLSSTLKHINCSFVYLLEQEPKCCTCKYNDILNAADVIACSHYQLECKQGQVNRLYLEFAKGRGTLMTNMFCRHGNVSGHSNLTEGLNELFQTSLIAIQFSLCKYLSRLLKYHNQ